MRDLRPFAMIAAVMGLLASTGSALPQDLPFVPMLRFVPIVPCRAFDTSASGGGPLPAAGRSFVVKGTTGFDTQGGHAHGCGVPASASAAQISLTGSTSGSSPLVSLAGGDVLAVGPNTPATEGVTADFDSHISDMIHLRSSGVGLQIIGDVTGYYVPEISNANSNTGSRFLAYAHVATGNYLFTVDRDVSSCAVTVRGSTTGNIGNGFTWTNHVTAHIGNWTGGVYTPVDDTPVVHVSC